MDGKTSVTCVCTDVETLATQSAFYSTRPRIESSPRAWLGSTSLWRCATSGTAATTGDESGRK
jgi:hypothetical protein